jgi:type I restriction enzyme S subunit
MSKQWPKVKLAEVLRRSEETIDLQPDAAYRQITVKLWGRGVVLRGILTGAEIAASRQIVARRGQFILSRIDARNGALGIVPPELDEAIVSNDFPVFNVIENRLLPPYLGWMCRAASFVEECKRASEGTTNRVRLQEDKFLAREIPLPPLAEQRQVVARIEELAAEIHEAHTLRHQSTEEAEALYPQCLGEAMTPHGDGWKRETVADVIKSIDAGWSPQCDDIPAQEGEWGVLKTTAVQWCEFQPQHNKALPSALEPIPGLAVKEGDVLVTRAGPRKRVAVVAAVRHDAPLLTISDKLIRLRTDRAKIEPRFLELSLASPFSQEHLVQRKTGLADAQVNISQAILKATPVAYPPIPEQGRLVAELAGLQAELDTLKRLQAETATELDALLPSILNRAFNEDI